MSWGAPLFFAGGSVNFEDFIVNAVLVLATIALALILACLIPLTCEVWRGVLR